MTENITWTGENGLYSPFDPCTLRKLYEAIKLRRSKVYTGKKCVFYLRGLRFTLSNIFFLRLRLRKNCYLEQI